MDKNYNYYNKGEGNFLYPDEFLVNMETNIFHNPELEEAIAKHPAIDMFHSLEKEYQKYSDEIGTLYNLTEEKILEVNIIDEKAKELREIKEPFYLKVQGEAILGKEYRFGDLIKSINDNLPQVPKQKILVIYTKDEILHQDNLLINNLKNVIEADNLSITDKLNYINTLYNIVKSDNYKSFILDNVDLIKNGKITELNKKFSDFKLQQQQRKENKIIPKAQNEKVKKTKKFFGKAK